MYVAARMPAGRVARLGRDVTSRRIPNWLTLALVSTGSRRASRRWRSPRPQSFIGLLVGSRLPLVLYALGGLAAGDVKLLAGVGAWVGPWPLVMIVAAAALVGLV